MRQSMAIRNDAGMVVIIIGVVALVAAWVAIWDELRLQREELIRRGGAETANLSRVLAEHGQRTIMGLDQTLLRLKSDYERDPSGFSIQSSLTTLVALRQVSVQVARIAADGRLADSSVAGFRPVDLSDRDHFRVHQSSPTKTLYISKPVQGRASGQWSIQLTRRLEKPNGDFDGVMVVSLDPYYLSGVYGALDLGQKSMIMLVGQDGVVRAANNGAVGKSLIDPAAVQRIFALSADTQHITGPADDVERIGSASTLSSYPLAVWVGRSQDDVLALHAKSRDSYLLAISIGSFVLVLGGFVLFRVLRTKKEVAEDLDAKKAELVSNRETLRSYAADLERIANVAAHDLQEPLRRVVAYAQLLASHVEHGLDQQGRDYVGHVVDGAIHMRKLVKDLETFVAVDHIPMANRMVEVSDALNQAATRLDDDLHRAQVTVIADVLPVVAADSRSLTEIFCQLLDNAIRYRVEDRQPVVQISARQEGDMVQITVRDNGRGIDPNNIPRVFELFNRLSGFEQPGHTGIGLAVVRRMVERMGGRIWAESVVGEGATFRFTLPVRLGAEASRGVVHPLAA